MSSSLRHDREDRQQHVAGGHVGEESDGQRERPHQELREELDRRPPGAAAPWARPAGDRVPDE